MARRQAGAAGAVAVKEAINRVYRVRGRDRAKRALAALTGSMAFSTLPEVRTLRRTLVYWRKDTAK